LRHVVSRVDLADADAHQGLPARIPGLAPAERGRVDIALRLRPRRAAVELAVGVGQRQEGPVVRRPLPAQVQGEARVLVVAPRSRGFRGVGVREVGVVAGSGSPRRGSGGRRPAARPAA
jgi:hypothetical protein